MIGAQRDAARRLRLAVIGVGGHAYRNLLPALTWLPVELVAVCDLDRALAERTARQYGGAVHDDADALFAHAGAEAVLLCVGPAQHPALARRAFAAGLHVWTEKPPAFAVAEVDAMIAARGDRVAVVGFKKAFMPAAAKARELLALPGFGALRSLLAVYPTEVPDDGERVLRDRVFSDWLGNGVHPLSFIVGVAGGAARVATHRGRHGGGCVVVELASGAIATLHLAAGAPGSQPVERYQLIGDGQTVEIDDSTTVRWQRGVPFAYGVSDSFAPSGVDHGAVVWRPQHMLATLEASTLFVQGMWQSLAHFVDRASAGTAATLGTLEQARQVMALYEAALRSRGEMVAVG